MQEVPATTSVKRNRAHNLDTDRLSRRREFILGSVLPNFTRSRADFGQRAMELAAIEDILTDRGALEERRTDAGGRVAKPDRQAPSH